MDRDEAKALLEHDQRAVPVMRRADGRAAVEDQRRVVLLVQVERPGPDRGP